MKKILIYSIAALVTVGLSGCEEWLDVNHDPNNATPDRLTEAIMLPAQQYAMLNNMTNSTYAWCLSHFLTKSGDFSGSYTFLSGQVMPQNLDSWWETYYYMNWNLKTMYDLAVTNEEPVYQAISEILQVINYQRMVDIWGDIPYSEACDPDNYTNPKYDDAQTIYADLITRAHAAAQTLEQADEAPVDLASADIICSGDLKLWTKLAYSVELRLLMRVFGVQSVGDQISAIYQKCLSPEENIDTKTFYIAETDKMNIFFESYGWDKNLSPSTNLRQYCPTSVLVDMLRDNNDPRLRVYADPRELLGNDEENGISYPSNLATERYIGIPFGQQNPAQLEYASTTGRGILAGGSDLTAGMTRPSTFMAGAEIGFLLAEAALEGWIPGGDPAAKDYYERSVISAFKRHEAAMQEDSENFMDWRNTKTLVGMREPITGTAEQEARVYLAQNSSFMNWDRMSSKDEKMNAICSQKWLAFMGYNPMEAWFEQRRTDKPQLPSSCWSGVLNPDHNISLLPYPQTERNLNMSNIPEASRDRNIFTTTVFWDKENPVVPQTSLY